MIQLLQLPLQDLLRLPYLQVEDATTDEAATSRHTLDALGCSDYLARAVEVLVCLAATVTNLVYDTTLFDVAAEHARLWDYGFLIRTIVCGQVLQGSSTTLSKGRV